MQRVLGTQPESLWEKVIGEIDCRVKIVEANANACIALAEYTQQHLVNTH